MKKSLLVSSSIFILSLSTGAYAADPIVAQEPAPHAAPVEAAPVDVTPAAFNWAGTYIGGQIDYTMMKAKYSASDLGEVTGKGKGFLGGIYTGANFDIGNNLVLGADMDFTMGTKGDKKNDKGDSVYARTQQRWGGAVRTRLGYTVDRFLPYIAGGLAVGSFKDSYKTPSIDFTSEKTRIGWTVGGGVDYAVTDNIILRGEYRYTDFGKQSFGSNNSGEFSRTLSSNDFRIGVAYKF